MIKLTDSEITSSYNVISEYHKKYLEKHGVKLPNLKKGNEYTKDALTLIYLFQFYPNTRTVSKSELTNFIKQYYPTINDVQQARHLGAQKGWFILSGTRNDTASNQLQPGEYKLKTLEEPYPGFTAQRRSEFIDSDYWENLKKQYNYECACCGSKEGSLHRYMKNVITRLQKGHKDPNKPLEAGNIIPQCEICNRADRNYWIYNDKGRVIKIANANVIDNCSKSIKIDIYTRLYNQFDGKNPSDLS